MKLFLISDNTDTLMGMRLAGIEGVYCRGKDDTEQEILKAVANPEIGILLITAKLTRLCHDMIVDRKLNYKRPLIEEIPDRHTSKGIMTSLERYVSEAVGIKL